MDRIPCLDNCKGTGKILRTTHPLTYVICETCKGVGTIDLKAEILEALQMATGDFYQWCDKELDEGVIAKALKDGTITLDEITERFKELLEKGVKDA